MRNNSIRINKEQFNVKKNEFTWCYAILNKVKTGQFSKKANSLFLHVDALFHAMIHYILHGTDSSSYYCTGTLEISYKLSLFYCYAYSTGVSFLLSSTRSPNKSSIVKRHSLLDIIYLNFVRGFISVIRGLPRIYCCLCVDSYVIINYFKFLYSATKF